MKFGSRLKQTSVPEWKSYNLDYNDIKRKIKLVTTIKNSNSRKDELVKDLYDSLVDQIDMVNLFLQSKVGEIKRRTIYIESLLDSIGEITTTDDPKVYVINTQITSLSSDLQKLSRFLVLQKTALRKLLKKYTKYAKDGGELNNEINKYVIENRDSFIHTDLSGLQLEIALIYDFIREISNPSGTPNSSPKKNNSRRRSSINDPVSGLNKDEVFDFESLQKSTQTLKFFVHYDNLNELKLFLLQNFYFIDQSMNNKKQYLKLKKKTSSLSMREIIASRTNKLQTVPEETKSTNNESLENSDFDGDDPHSENTNGNDIYGSNSIYLNKADDTAIGSNLTQLVFDDPNNFSSIKNNTDPTILLTKSEERFRSLLISAIGGLRKNSSVLFGDSHILSNLLESCLNDDSFEEFQNNNIEFAQSLNSLEKISIEYLFKKHFKPLLKSAVIKSRYSNSFNYDQNEFKCWISLQSNIRISMKDLHSPLWSKDNELDSDTIPYAYLQIRHNSPSHSISSFPESLQNLINSHLIYEINDSNFSILTYSLYKCGHLSFKPHWAELFEEKDIRKLPPKVAPLRKNKTKQLEISDNDVHNESAASGESSQQFRYWNEFDNGSEYDGNDNDGFFIPLGDDDDSREPRLLLFSDSTVEKFYQMSNTLSKVLHEKLPFIFEALSKDDPQQNGIHYDNDGLISNASPYGNYGAVSQSDARSITSVSTGSSLLYDTETSKYEHDRFLMFLALLTSLISLFLTAISLGISTSLLSIGDVLINGYVIFVLVFALLTSLFFSVLSMCLYTMCDAENKSHLQSAFIWSNFILVNLMIIGGLVSAFGI
jgi:SPX domain protein involved in polyphosphate accumulation